MRRSHGSVFGDSRSFRDAYPHVETIRVTGEQDHTHVHNAGERDVTAHYGPGSTSINAEFPCRNPECVNGTLRWSTKADLDGMVQRRETQKTVRVECGMPYRGKTCLNYATVTVTITYKPA